MMLDPPPFQKKWRHYCKLPILSPLHTLHFAFSPPHSRRGKLREALSTASRLMITSCIFLSKCQPTGFYSVGWILSERRAGSFQFIIPKNETVKKKCTLSQILISNNRNVHANPPLTSHSEFFPLVSQHVPLKRSNPRMS